ncbi:MAG: PHB depolymerase family esterase [Candidatus Dormibacteria bacterium]
MARSVLTSAVGVLALLLAAVTTWHADASAARATASIRLPQANCKQYATLTAAEAATPAWTATDDPGGGSYVYCPSYSLNSPSLGATVSRSYWVYVPSAYDPTQQWPLVVALHGCSQQGPDLAYISDFDKEADSQHFLVLYPNQSTYAQDTPTTFDGNGSFCWNWFLPQGQARGDDEPALIAGITTTVRDGMDVDPNRVYMLVVSAGAATADIIAATYPELYASVAVVAGCEYKGLPCFGSATTVPPQVSAQEAYAAAPTHHVMPFLVENGDADTVVPVQNAFFVAQQLQLTNDSVEHNGTPVNMVPSSYCSDQRVVPNPAVDDSVTPPIVYNPYDIYSYTVDGGACPGASAFDADTSCAQLYVVHGEFHAWPGGPNLNTTQSDAQIYTNPGGPDMTDIAYRFFTAHPMHADLSACGAAPATDVPDVRAAAALPIAGIAVLLTLAIRRSRRSP